MDILNIYRLPQADAIVLLVQELRSMYAEAQNGMAASLHTIVILEQRIKDLEAENVDLRDKLRGLAT
jgi:hypothetical protein